MSCWFWGERDRGMFWRDSPRESVCDGLVLSSHIPDVLMFTARRHEHHHGVLIMRSQARLKEELNLERCAHVLTGLIMNASPAFHVIRHLWKVYMLAALWYHIVPGLHGALPAPALTRPHFLLLFFHTCGWHEHLHLSRLMKHTVFYFTYLFSDAGKVIYSTFCI